MRRKGFFAFRGNVKGRLSLFIVFCFILVFFLATSIFGQEESEFRLTSPAFDNMGMIPIKYTCDGINVSPKLVWGGVPEGCVTLALVVDDPDAPRKTWVHWVIWNIGPDMGGLSENAVAEEIGASAGKNDFGNYIYKGPCPPSGTHRYRFTLYALSGYPDIEAGATKGKLAGAIKDITISTCTLTGRYRR
jgi:Raf kinase inhibitor-like YbhB/YbcL family protein